MLGLPKQTEIKRQLSKSAIYSKFQMNNVQKEKIDADISKMVIVNEILPSTVSIAAGNNVQAFFVVNVILKRKDYDEKSIIAISKLISQNLLFALECENEIRLAVYHSKLIQSEWQSKENVKIELKGLDLDGVWENVIKQIGDIQVTQGNTLDEQIAIDDKKMRLEKEIARLEKQARNEKQPKKKFELVQLINKHKQELVSLN